eukprot:4945089-Prymnesium_polylepis.1
MQTDSRTNCTLDCAALVCSPAAPLRVAVGAGSHGDHQPHRRLRSHHRQCATAAVKEHDAHLHRGCATAAHARRPCGAGALSCMGPLRRKRLVLPRAVCSISPHPRLLTGWALPPLVFWQLSPTAK